MLLHFAERAASGIDPPGWYLEAILAEGAMRVLVANLDQLDASQAALSVGLITKLVLASPQLAGECIQVRDTSNCYRATSALMLPYDW
jgi:hypothetical protein